MKLPVSGDSVPLKSTLPTKKFQGMTIVIETPKGTIRSGRGPEGEWSNVSPADYGFIEGTRGADGDEMDCYLGPDSSSEVVYVADQNRMESPKFDEHKCFLGYSSITEAKRAYLLGHSHGSKILRHITPMRMAKFKQWLKYGNHDSPVGLHADS